MKETKINTRHTVVQSCTALLLLVFFLVGCVASVSAQSAVAISDVTDKGKSALANNEQGVALLRSGHYTEAAELFQRAIELKPDFGVAYNNLGGIYIVLDRPRQALGFLQHALPIKPHYA